MTIDPPGPTPRGPVPPGAPSGPAPLLSVRDMVVSVSGRRRAPVQAVAGVSFDVAPGETLGLVGESGCGKSSLARAILQLPRPTGGRVSFEGVELTALSPRQLRAVRPRLQMVFQDPASSLNPRRPVRDQVADALVIAGAPDDPGARADSLLDLVGIDPALGGRLPHTFSGGQCQRIAIARALICEPRLLICDEPVSALDASVQAQVINLLEDLKARYGLTMVFISHDLAVVANVSDQVAVMYLGRLCEIVPAARLASGPAHPYTQQLLGAVARPGRGGHRRRPSEDAEQSVVADRPSPAAGGEVPAMGGPACGCRFRSRCPRAEAHCETTEPVLRPVADGHLVACHFPAV